ncbi:MAG TPA: hypothetical protein VID76_00110 [Solirubrobacterales bacterium]
MKGARPGHRVHAAAAASSAAANLPKHENVDDDVQGLIALVVIAVGGVCMATGVLARLTHMVSEAVGALF